MARIGHRRTVGLLILVCSFSAAHGSSSCTTGRHCQASPGPPQLDDACRRDYSTRGCQCKQASKCTAQPPAVPRVEKRSRAKSLRPSADRLDLSRDRSSSCQFYVHLRGSGFHYLSDLFVPPEKVKQRIAQRRRVESDGRVTESMLTINIQHIKDTSG